MGDDQAVGRGAADEITAGDQPKVAQPYARTQRTERHRDRIALGCGCRPQPTLVAVSREAEILWPGARTGPAAAWRDRALSDRFSAAVVALVRSRLALAAIGVLLTYLLQH
jgi:hypothetical protein